MPDPSPDEIQAVSKNVMQGILRLLPELRGSNVLDASQRYIMTDVERNQYGRKGHPSLFHSISTDSLFSHPHGQASHANME